MHSPPLFDTPGPRLFGVAPGADFAAEVVAGLADRLADAPPEAWARITLFANSGRMAGHLADALASGPSRLLPRIRTVADLAEDAGFPDIPPARTGLDLKLDLACLVLRLIEADPTLAPRSAIFDLADSLAALLDEMHGEGVSAEALGRIDVGVHAHHWARSRAIVQAAFDHFGAQPDLLPGAEARRAMIVDLLTAQWAEAPPNHPVLVVGSTGSRGATRRLMAAVARLPQGAVILPGYDHHQPDAVWDQLDQALSGEDHPQFRFRTLMTDLGLAPDQVTSWSATVTPDDGRNRLISLALRPAPVTDAWLTEGPRIGDPLDLTRGLTLLEAPGPRHEAMAIALRLREALETGQSATVVSPDQGLIRRVTAALDQWGIVPDDSTGVPLNLMPAGRLLRHLADWVADGPSLPALITLLKHPLAAVGDGRGTHLRHTRDAELWLRRKRVSDPTPETLVAWAKDNAERLAWATWVGETLWAATPVKPDLGQALGHIRALAEGLCRGLKPPSQDPLWHDAEGTAVLTTLQELETAAAAAPPVTAADVARLLDRHLAAGQARNPHPTHPSLSIIGTIETRTSTADLMILGGMNESIWPASPTPDPWLNRAMRAEAGLLLPDRRIGLAAHDVQIGLGAREVLLTRSRLEDGAETVPSRWLNRLTNLLDGLDGGDQALAQMRRKGRALLAQAEALAAPHPSEIQPRAPRPAPRPPVQMRPTELSVTAVTTLRRDPYAIYANRILHLNRLDPLAPLDDAMTKGTALHRVMEAFLLTRDAWRGDPEAARAALAEATTQHLTDRVADPVQRAFWQARFGLVADRIIRGEENRLAAGDPLVMEKAGGVLLRTVAFRLTAKPDRVDRREDGSYAVFDYKSGAPPSESQVDTLDRQLPLTAALIERGGFDDLTPGLVSHMAYIGLGAAASEENAIKIDTKDGARRPDTAWEDLIALVEKFGQRSTGYGARISAVMTTFSGDFDHLARFGEWTHAQRATPIDVGPPE